MSEDTQDKAYKVTLKAGESYNEPWVTVQADTEAQLAFLLKDLVDKGTFALVGEASTALRQATHAVQTAATVLGGQVQQGQVAQVAQAPQPPQQSYQQPQQQGQVLQFPQQPQAQPQQDNGGRVAPLENDFVGKGGHWPPAGPRPSCLHGPRDWKSFNSKAGKLTEMWACPFDRKGAFIPPGQSKCDVEWAN